MGEINWILNKTTNVTVRIINSSKSPEVYPPLVYNFKWMNINFYAKRITSFKLNILQNFYLSGNSEDFRCGYRINRLKLWTSDARLLFSYIMWLLNAFHYKEIGTEYGNTLVITQFCFVINLHKNLSCKRQLLVRNFNLYAASVNCLLFELDFPCFNINRFKVNALSLNIIYCGKYPLR